MNSDQIGKGKDCLIEWIKNYVHRAGAKGVVIGLSGGIDSAVVAALAAKAIGKENVLGVILPCESDPQDEEDALIVVKWLGIEHRIVGLDDPFYYFTRRVAPLVDSDIVTEANVKARLRMTVLYAFANKYNFLNIGTGNQSELEIGYFTKYGDGGVDLEPLGNFYKTEVYEIARILDVPDHIIKRVPSAGLWEGQTDEGEIGMAYERLDAILRLRDDGCSAMGIVVRCSLKQRRRVHELVEKSAHKRIMPPSYERAK